MVFIKSIVVYFQFFTRIVIPVEIDDFLYYLKHGSKFFPAFGLLLGAIEGTILWLGSWLFTDILGFILMLFADVLITGAMHQDGLADACDGLFSSRQPDRMLTIMKDSRIGTMGTVGLIFYYMIMLGIFISFPALFAGRDGFILVILMQMVAKSNMTLLFYKLNYKGASADGLGNTWSNTPTADIVIAQVISMALLTVFYRLDGLLIYFVGIVSVLFYRKFVYNKVGGMNGDTLGASALISHIVFLLARGIL